MTREERLQEAMRDLRKFSAGGASQAAEACMMAEFRKQHTGRRRGWRWAAVGAIAASVLIASVLRLSDPDPVEAPANEVAIAPPQASLRPIPQLPEREPARRVPKKAVRVRRAVRPSVQESSEQAFDAIPYAPPMRAGEPLHVIRVKLPDGVGRRVEADVLSGQDGIARAIRFVR